LKEEKKKRTSKGSGSVIYGIADDSGRIVYVGKTLNFQNRSRIYLSGQSHNVALNEWMKSNDWHFEVLETNPIDINVAEKMYISKYKDQIFNMVNGGEQSWRHHDRTPWMAKTGILCPSDMLLKYLRNRKAKTTRR
jgi:excinuclease UvrABC nuclease subunit